MKPKVCIFFLLILGAALQQVQAGTKEELVRLQNDVIALQNQLREFDKAFNERVDGLKSLVVQLNDQVAKSNLTLSNISASIENQASGVRSSDQTLLQEIRLLSSKIDDASTRISVLAQQVAELKIQSKPISEETASGRNTSPDSLFNQANDDLVRANFDMAIQGFNAYLSSNPVGDKTSAALYGLGEAYFRQSKMPEAIAAFTRVITEFPGEPRIPTAFYRRGQAELTAGETNKAVADFRQIIEQYPTASEATLAKAELQKLGVKPTAEPAKPPARRKTR
jgi:tol-pal system protein YbgF